MKKIGENTTMVTCHFVFQCLWLEAAISDHYANPQYLKDRAFFAYLSSQKTMLKWLQGELHSCLSWGWGWEMDLCYCDMSWNWLKLMQFTIQAFPWKLKAFSWLQNSKIVTLGRSCQCNYCLSRESDFWYFLLYHLSRTQVSIF